MLIKYLIAIASFLLVLQPVELLGQTYTVEVIERHLYGPGPFPDQKLKTAWIRNINLEKFLVGTVKGSNNLGVAPNVSGELLQNLKVDGKLSDGTLINEDIDMSNVVIMNGQFNLLLAAVYGGPNKGDTFFYLDDEYNWWIKDDIAIDPGFRAGIVKIDNFTFSTRPREIPFSLQSELGYPGGTNQIGSLTAGRVAMGRLGDDDQDGYLDGVFNAIGRFPLQSIFLPGAPFVQLFEFKSDIPILPFQSALLTVASARSHINLISVLEESNPNHPDIPSLWKSVKSRLKQAEIHIGLTARDQVHCKEDCIPLNELSKKIETAESTGDKKQLRSVIEYVYKALISALESNNG